MDPFANYCLFGTPFSSQLDFPFLPEARFAEQPQVSLKWGQVPESLPQPSIRTPFFEWAPESILFRLPSQGKALLTRGSEILIQPEAKACEDSWRLFVLGPIWGALLHQRGALPFHAAAVAHSAGCSLFCGPSACGKSTLLLDLVRAGFDFFCDELCVLEERNSELLAGTGVPLHQLWADTLRAKGLETASFRPVRPLLEKFWVPPAQTSAAQKLPIRGIYLLNWANNHTEPRLQAVTANLRFERLLGCVYRRRFLSANPAKAHSFRLLALLAKNVPLYQLFLPHDSKRLDETVALLMRQWSEG